MNFVAVRMLDELGTLNRERVRYQCRAQDRVVLIEENACEKIKMATV